MKNDRHAMILAIIERDEVATQGELMRMLQNEGVRVTQATLSRDVREMRLVKVKGELGYRYAAYTEDNSGDLDMRIVSVFRQAVLSVESAQNILCLHTISGMANAAGVAVDGMSDRRVLGCVAGDDTIFVLVRTQQEAVELSKTFKSMMKKKE